jgi:Protein of unknown function (DUF2946)
MRDPMRRLITGRIQRELLTSLLLVAVAFRALIPVGFMPSAERPFSLEICHAGTLALPAATSGGSDHSVPHDHSSHFEHCPFGSAPGTGPLSSLPQVERTALGAPLSISHFATLRLGVRLDRAHAARAPPVLA